MISFKLNALLHCFIDTPSVQAAQRLTAGTLSHIIPVPYHSSILPAASSMAWLLCQLWTPFRGCSCAPEGGS
jgi:hypothetical protein